MKAEKIIEQIISRHPEISRKEILERLDIEKRKTDGFISDDILLQMIAADLGVETLKETHTPTLSIQDLVPGLNNVTIVGRVIALFPAKAFKGNRSGKVASLLIADKNSVLRIVLWNDKTSLIESGKLEVGQIIRFSHGYTRGEYGGVELHLSDRSEVEVDPDDVETKDYPTIGKFITKIGEITQKHKNKKLSIEGTLKRLLSTSTFKRSDSSSGKVMRLVIADETGKISVVVWNEKVDELEEILEKNVKLQIVNAKVKKAISNGLEVHVNAGTYVRMITSEKEFLKIADLEESLKHVNVEGKVVSMPILRKVKTSKGELVNLAVLELKDETGRIWISAWRRHADTASKLKIGDEITVKNAYVKKGFGDKAELSTRNATSIEFLSLTPKTNNKE